MIQLTNHSSAHGDDDNVVRAALEYNGRTLEYASERIKKDKKMVLIAVSGGYDNGYGLHFASKDLQNDKEVVKTAVSSTGDALKYASDNLKKDYDVIEAAVDRNYCSIQVADSSILLDISFLGKLAKKHPGVKRIIMELYERMINSVVAEDENQSEEEPVHAAHI